MSKSIIREDKTCLNCRHVVEKRFCPTCGQENTDTRKTFHHLFIHFFEDLTHYENAFWKTIKNLLLKPATLTKEYLSGKRLSYLAPVRLYIFISFITFFLIAVFPNPSSEKINVKETTANTIQINEKDDYFNPETLKEYDTIHSTATKDKKDSALEHWIMTKVRKVTEHNTRAEITEKFIKAFSSNFPKVLFIYMPLFAFFLWLFHNKKKWYYFDHGIFTLHYFSFLLLISLLLFLVGKLFSLLGDSTFADLILGFINIIGFGWMIYYFYPAHRRFYEETKLVSFAKATTLFFINLLFIFIILLLFAFYTFINLH